ncbi:hypothetical protein [Amycolatopsis sp. 195334CR]|uniref:hypothetical protein n=1 Tax=Amycolatopsis sp. 195334CR TaxID=2814588 RepID=UPI001A907B3E|nr:hypothetical protein [Amycolatopsis sp. 195334CR]MBN6034197.1 hypothetical protein [Amycolatopsis sp. 195334CR]
MDTDPDSDHSDLERRAHRAAIGNLPVAKWALGVGVLGVAVAVIFGVVSACGPDDTPPPPPAPEVNQPGTGNVNCDDGATCTVTLGQAQQLVQNAATQAGSDDTTLKKTLRAESGASAPPSGPGPYPFVVVDTVDLGLFARTANTVSAVRIGYTANRSLVWANCTARSDFTPSDVTGENNVGPIWLQVRWKHLPAGTNQGLSEPNETQTAWMYRGALEPVGHNGAIPPC